MNKKIKLTEFPIQKLNDNPWRFRLMYDKDFKSLVKEIKENGIDIISPPVIAELNKKYYVVDGHSRINAAKKVGIKKIQCRFVTSIKNLSDLRTRSFNLNREGYSNPLILSDMFDEDLQILGTVKDVADAYNVNERYVESVLKIKNLHDDTKSLINKVIDVAKKKYQFVLNQLTPEHISSLSDLSPEKQVQVIDWILRDIMFGPADESLVSVPSIYEIIEEISQITKQQEKTTYKKQTNKILNSKVKDFPLVCKCGTKYEIDIKSNSVYELVEQHKIILKKKFEGNETAQIYSSESYDKNKLIKIIQESKHDVRVVVLKGK